MSVHGRARRGTAIRAAAASPRLRRLLVSYLAFCVTEWCFWIAPLVWAYDVGGVRAASLMSVVELVPTALLAPVVASWCDRLRRPRALVAGYLAQLVTLAVLGVALTVAPPVPVFVAAALTCIANSATRPVHYAILPDIAETAEELTASNAMSSGAEAAAAFLGPLATGLLMVPWGPGAPVLAGAGLIGVAALVVLPLDRGPIGREGRAETTGSPPGWRSLVRDPTARLFGVLTFAENVLFGALDILIVVLALDLLGLPRSGPGLLNSAVGVGALVGTGATLVLVGLRRLTPAVVLGAVVAGVPIAFAGLAHSTVPAVILVAVAGAGRLFYGVGSFTLLQRSVSDRMLVGVFGVLESMMSAGMASGAVLAPVLISLAGASGAFVVVGLLLPVTALACLRGLHRADTRSQVATQDVARLQQIPFLGYLTPLVLERLVREQTRFTAPPGTCVVREGDPGEAFFVIESGHLSVSRGGVPVGELGPGDWFGELALLRDAPRSASVRALDRVSLVVLDRAAFLDAVTRGPRPLEAAYHEAARRYSSPSGGESPRPGP
jgi:MFS family permease